MVKDQLKCKYVSDVLAVLEGPMYVCAEVMFVFGTIECTTASSPQGPRQWTSWRCSGVLAWRLTTTAVVSRGSTGWGSGAFSSRVPHKIGMFVDLSP